MPNPITPFAIQAGEGEKLHTPTGDQVWIKAHTRNTNGSLTVMEFEFAPKSGPALHTHLREDEVWYVLEGDFRFKAGDAMLEASTGGMAFGPRGMPHNFQNVGETPGRLLVISTPSGLERFFQQFAELHAGEVSWDRLAGVGDPNWLEFSGPPLNITDPL